MFAEWNASELESYLIEITSLIFAKKDDVAGEGHILDKARCCCCARGGCLLRGIVGYRRDGQLIFTNRLTN